MFADRLFEKITQKKNPTVAGLDPRLEYIPEKIRKACYDKYGETLEGAAAAILEFNKELIDALQDIVPAVKLQLACYEQFAVPGMKAFEDTISYAKEKGLIVIADGKRNDIGSTAESYSKAFLAHDEKMNAFDADALTVNPYLGIDGVKPFIDDCIKYDKGIFILVKTSNKSSGQLQDLTTDDGRKIYEIVAQYVDEWGSGIIGNCGYSSIGAVVGATYPEQASILRKIMKKAPILVPGYGAQGGSASDAARSFNRDGLGAVVNASRSIMCAYKSETWKNNYSEDKFAEASRAEAIKMRDELNKVISKDM